MAIEFKLPDIGEGLHEAELLQWLVKEGDMVREDQPLLEVQTDKASVEIPSPVQGKVVQLLGKVGDTLHVGSVVVIFDDGKGATATDTQKQKDNPDKVTESQAPAKQAERPAQAAPAATAPAQAATAPAAASEAATSAAAAPSPAHASAQGGRALAAPATRKLARELNIDINQVHGSGPAGRVTAEDLKQFANGGQAAAQAEQAEQGNAAGGAAAPTPAPYVSPAGAVEERIPLKGIRKVIAERMVLSKHTAAHVTITEEVDMTELIALRAKAKPMAAKRDIKLSFMPFIFKALTAALKEFPYLNASVDDAKQEIVLKKYYHMGYALDVDAGLLVPVIKDVDRKSVLTIAKEMQEQIGRGREGKLAPDEMKGSTFTVSNMGSVGGLFFTPVINHPEVAILGVGKTQERPVVRDGEIVIRSMCYLSLSFDHRVVDGALATRFIARVVELLGDPTLLMLEA
ncbi:MAG: pyruvate/2-oxoglutarate dehydrogenase complex, dihydrolipoamide acyltransferase component [Firmicutes bacterium]|nr:pyruvate/2-oxoglutarate dehydrogenase complex, dihydrolipoamide acyltransferase component [Bacillota bacterium]